MASAVLTTLCAICHAKPPIYTCPGCRARTCSLDCVRRHKSRRDCDGKRNPAAYVPVEQLKTPAMFDHDYNFITSIERACQRTEKDVIEARCLLSEKDLHPDDEAKKFQQVWYGDELHHFPITASEQKGGEAKSFSRLVRGRMQRLDIEVVTMPKGMSRQKQNTTTWNAKKSTINWQVEWCIHGVEGIGNGPPARVYRKVLDNMQLNEALVWTIAWQKGQLDRANRENEEDDDSEGGAPARKRRRRKRKPQGGTDAAQSPISTCWVPSEYTLQYSLTGEWNQTSTAASIPKTVEEEATMYAHWQFFLQKALVPGSPDKTKSLIPINPKSSLSQVLEGRTVVEFPTIYVLPPSAPLPGGFVLGSTAWRRRKIEVVGEGDGDTEEQPPFKKQASQREHVQREPSQREQVQREPTQREQFQRGKNQRDQARTRGGRGGARGKWEPRRGRGGRTQGVMAKTERRPLVADEDVDEGEIDSDGDDVKMGGMCHESKAGRGTAIGGGGSVGGSKKPTGLVDYGSSDDSA